MDAQTRLGALYEEGKGVPQDYKEAAALYQKAATAGGKVAQNMLGLLYEAGKGVPKDYEQAVSLFRESAEFVTATRNTIFAGCIQED